MKLHINARSIWILQRIDEHIRFCNIRGPIERFRDVAADPLDGLVIRSEFDDLIRRNLLKVVKYGFDDSMGRDPMRDSQPDLCGTSWSVNPTDRLIMGLWRHRVVDSHPATKKQRGSEVMAREAAQVLADEKVRLEGLELSRPKLGGAA